MKEKKQEEVNVENKKKIKFDPQRGLIRIVAVIAIVTMLAATFGSLIYYLMNA